VQAGPDGLYDRTRACHQAPQRLPPELERAILRIRRRLRAHAAPATRSCLIGARAIRAELKEEASRTVSPAGDGYRLWVADSLPERASAEALALQAMEQLTDI
jgi:hypothetical protein